MFGVKNSNFTGFSFIAKLGTVGFEFTAGLIEEVTLNVTSSVAAHAAEIPEYINVKLISKNQFIASIYTVVTSKIAQTKLFDLIASATTNLII